jgi:hypothetical protein
MDGWMWDMALTVAVMVRRIPGDQGEPKALWGSGVSVKLSPTSAQCTELLSE